MKLVILDRDGVINQDSPHYIKSPDEWIALPGSLEAIASLNQNGFRVALATNQSGISRGIYDMATLNAIHDKMQRALAQLGGRIDALFYCPHVNEDLCNCRKPKSGMFEDIAERFGVELNDVPCVGDSLRDLVASANAGGKPLLVRTGNGEKTLAAGNLPEGTLVFADLAEAAGYIIKNYH
jgi:D-glycero-D-manno-heptose 1,7-bisphosphate phosphatase